ncbi:hypothetical protein V1515DRAFT_609946 [Lipomyces mesembrius]
MRLLLNSSKPRTARLAIIISVTLCLVGSFSFFRWIRTGLLSLRLQDTNASSTNNSQDALPAVAKCEDSLRPNLILTAIDGPKWVDQIFIFCQSLELALGRELVSKLQQNNCPPAQLAVKIIVPPQLARSLPDGFKSLMERYSFLQFVGALPDEHVPVVLRRFQGFLNVVGDVPSGEASYNNILVCDLDVVFQRNPFAMPMKPGEALHYFAEWRGLKIGQCHYHMRWFRGCANAAGGPFITEAQIASYQPLDRICAGSIYGTAGAISVYLQTMASELLKSRYRCNDQAMHIHIYYSNLLDANLSQAGVGRVLLVPNDEALLGTVHTTPMVRFNAWGEILNELGEVQVAVHQYKHHSILSKIVRKRYGWIADISTAVVPPVPALKEEEEDGETEKGSKSSSYSQQQPQIISRFRLEGVSSNSCQKDGSLCSCTFNDCQFKYDEYRP